jgi:DNA-binding SARP family transcriptional activator
LRDNSTVLRRRYPPRQPAGRESREEGAVRLGLLQGFELFVRGQPVSLPLSAQRVLAFLALHDRPLQRLYVAGTLWLNSTDTKAGASLRTALWRLRTPNLRLVEATATHLELAACVEVDVRETKAAAEQAIRHEIGPDDESAAALYHAGELLQDWCEDWILIERERLRQLQLHALETLCADLTAAGRYPEAARAGLAAVKGEPLRESAHRALIGAYLAEGNPGEALRQFRLFRDLLREKLGLEPSPLILNLMSALPIR